MLDRSRVLALVATLALLATACQQAQPNRQTTNPAPASSGQSAAQPSKPSAQQAAAGPTRVTIGVTETIENQNPYADSIALGYGIWCEVQGCLVSYDADRSEFRPSLAESWRVDNPTTWTFTLRKDVKWHDGSPFTSADLFHSFWRIGNDPTSKQKHNLNPVASYEAVDPYTFRVTTKEPTADLLSFFADLLIVTSKAQYDQHGPDAISTVAPIGTGPFMFKELVPNQRFVIQKNPNWWGGPVNGPDEVVYRIMRETEVRITALLNGEIQIAQFVPPHMLDRVANAPNAKIVATDSVEIMFLAMSPRTKPWDNKLVRQAVAYAIDRDAIISGVLMGQAKRLDGPVGAGTYAYDPNLQPRYTYNPERARQLLREAGYPNGVDVELYTPVNRYVQDKQTAEAITSQLTAVGIRTKLVTPEWPTMWSDVQAGKTAFYYMGRGSILDPGAPLQQYFETGGSPRVGYSSPQFDALMAKARASFDPEERKRALREMMSFLTDDAPAHFLFTINMLWGTSKNIDYAARPDTRIFAQDIRVLQ